MESEGCARARRALLFAFALTLVYFTGFFPPGNNPNELSRIQAIFAFAERGTFAIDEPLDRFGNHEDKSFANGRSYSNKAPGLAFAAIPVYRILRVFFPEPSAGTSPIFVLTRLLTVSLLSVAAVSRLARRLARSPGGGATAPAIACAVAFGTPFLYYARSFFSHAWSASLLYLAWELIRDSEEPERRRRGALLVGAGLLAGWASISEYTVAPVAALLALRAGWGFGFRRALVFAAGAAPALGLLLLYNAACFGSPWVLSSAREATPHFAELARRGVFGMGVPSPGVAARLLLHPSRGVLAFSPFLLWAAGGWIRWWRSGIDRRDCLFVLAACTALFLPIAAYPSWEGGWCLGSRYLLPVLLFASLAIPYALSSPLSRGLFLFASAFSIANLFLLTSAYPHIPPTIRWPAANLSWFLISSGAVAPNLGRMAGLPPVLSLLVPLAAAAAVFAGSARLLGRTVPKPAAAAGAALLVLALTIARPPALPEWDQNWRVELRRHLLEADRARSPRRGNISVSP